MAAVPKLNKAIFTPSLYQSIRDLWFGGLPWGAKAATDEANDRWFTGTKEAKAAFDGICHQKFDPAILAISPANFPIAGLSGAEIAAPFVAEIEATEGGREEDKTKTALSLMILLDQIPRNFYRTKETLPIVYGHYDPIALSLAQHILANPDHERLDLHSGIRRSLPYRQWIYMPLMHSESITAHTTMTSIIEDMKEECKEDEEIVKYIAHMEKFEGIHFSIIEKFGRYPHRNNCLGRETTEAEREWLESGGEKFGVGG
ncbi:hypothetical protein TWF694_009405 [Orbilia ellipsospora]|uniref:DUF924-domain-containing protein n=1 Tax=Orbilia ellipsospora TaxID=2528407 RepID=A0AAV9XB07_9PEZI